MIAEGMRHTLYSFGNMIKAYVKSRRVDDAFAVYDKMKKSGIVPTQVRVALKKSQTNAHMTRLNHPFGHAANLHNAHERMHRCR
jgi:pentatricopeptide repeat protein